MANSIDENWFDDLLGQFVYPDPMVLHSDPQDAIITTPQQFQNAEFSNQGPLDDVNDESNQSISRKLGELENM